MIFTVCYSNSGVSERSVFTQVNHLKSEAYRALFFFMCIFSDTIQSARRHGESIAARLQPLANTEAIHFVNTVRLRCSPGIGIVFKSVFI